MPTSKGNAQWNGSFKTGSGVMKPAHGPDIGYSVASRFEGQPQSNPEELIGAALSGCFSMALSLGLETAGFTPTSIRTAAEVHLEKQAAGFTITTIALTSECVVPGIDAAKFQELAEATKKACPVSRALSAVTITLKTSLTNSAA